jgi:hypothetical protein
VTRLLAFGYMMSATATVLAWPVAKRRPDHYPIAILLTFGLGSDLARRALREYVLTPEYARLAGAPSTGWVRVVFNVEQALFLAWPAGLAAVVLWVHLKQRPWPVGVGYLAGVFGIAIIGYPTIRGDLLHKAYLGFELACLVVAVGAILHWLAFRKEPPRTSHWILALMVGAEIVGLMAGAWRFGIFTTWTLAQIAYCMLYAVLTVINGAVLWMWNKSSPS